jgi:glycosyltransferase involved in cell wall biosynthesis
VARKILYFYTAESSFVQKDIRILESAYTVKTFLFSMASKKSWPLTFIRQKLFLLRHLWGPTLVVCQFAGMHAVLPVFFAGMFRKKSVVVPGGTDCVGFPSINYGNFAARLNRKFTEYVYRHVSLIIPVHETLVDYPYTYESADFPRQGIRFFMPALRTPIKVIHNGYDSNLFTRNNVTKQNNSFVTVVAYNNSRFTEKLKGLDLFKGLARAFPDSPFYIIGGGGTLTKEQIPNLHYIPNLTPAKLVEKLSEFRYYVQLSLSEGFPNALSEAMLCECIPIVSAVGGMPDIVGDCGVVVPRRDQAEVNEIVHQLLGRNDHEETGLRARKRIADRYSLDARKQKMLDTLDQLWLS